MSRLFSPLTSFTPKKHGENDFDVARSHTSNVTTRNKNSLRGWGTCKLVLISKTLMIQMIQVVKIQLLFTTDLSFTRLKLNRWAWDKVSRNPDFKSNLQCVNQLTYYLLWWCKDPTWPVPLHFLKRTLSHGSHPKLNSLFDQTL